jgi:hypothetical protein
MAGRLSRILAILKNAPRQIVASYRKGYDSAPAVPPPEALRSRENPPADSPSAKKNPPAK